MMVFQVEGMTCGHCVAAVTNAIKALDSNAKVTVDLATGLVRVEAALSEVQVMTALAEEGYSAGLG